MHLVHADALKRRHARKRRMGVRPSPSERKDSHEKDVDDPVVPDPDSCPDRRRLSGRIRRANRASTSDNAAQAADSETSETDTNILIAYFSWSGNTEAVAQIIAEQTGGDLFAIEPATPYTDDYDELLDVARQEQSEDARPELAAQVENWADYDVIFVGYPNWWSDAPMAVYTFLNRMIAPARR